MTARAWPAGGKLGLARGLRVNSASGARQRWSRTKRPRPGPNPRGYLVTGRPRRACLMAARALPGFKCSVPGACRVQVRVTWLSVFGLTLPLDGLRVEEGLLG